MNINDIAIGLKTGVEPIQHRAMDMNTLHSMRTPFQRIGGVYFLFLGATCVYVGQAQDVMFRIHTHARKGHRGIGSDAKVFDAFSVIECRREDRDALERHYIETLQPDLNRDKNGRLVLNVGSVRPKRLRRQAEKRRRLSVSNIVRIGAEVHA